MTVFYVYLFAVGFGLLRHHNRILDLGNTVRFSGLPNNATVEMVATTKSRTESRVELALTLENGPRLMKDFSPQRKYPF